MDRTLFKNSKSQNLDDANSFYCSEESSIPQFNEGESEKYLEKWKVTVYKHQYPRIEETKSGHKEQHQFDHELMFENSDGDLKIQNSDASKCVSIEKSSLTPTRLNYKTSSGINSLDFKTAITEFLSWNLNDSQHKISNHDDNPIL